MEKDEKNIENEKNFQEKNDNKKIFMKIHHYYQ